MDKTVTNIVEHIQNKYGTDPEHLWTKYPNYSVFRHPMSGKWYAIIMDIPKVKLGLDGNDTVYVLDIKCDPLMIGSLLSERGFYPAYHMNKNTWISIVLDGSLSYDKIYALIELSFDSVSPKRK